MKNCIGIQKHNCEIYCIIYQYFINYIICTHLINDIETSVYTLLSK